ncbi:MAG: YicC family protein [Burkholderiaceae bacterium]|nr:YicC family protein [Burkholderiaceae bacterium]
MSVYSMTGYASVQSEGAESAGLAVSRIGTHHRIGLEIRSVNSRFLDIGFRLPDELRECEPALRELLGRHLKRGKVEVRISLGSGDGPALADPPPRLLQRLNALQDSVRTWLPDAAGLSVAEVLKLAAADSPARAAFSEQLLPLAEKAVSALREARLREGERLASMLTDRLTQLAQLVARVVPLVPQLVEVQRTRFLERWAEALSLAGSSALPDTAHERAMTEAASYAIKIDVAEEVSRLNSHLDEIGRLLTQGGEVGKRLEFLIQELHREANTLGSKSGALELTRIAVDMKVLIEQMREQIQNIE